MYNKCMDPKPNLDESIDSPRIGALGALEKEKALEIINEKIITRLSVLEENSHFNQDSMMIAEGLERILHELGVDLGEENLREARIAAILHDIGKSGPAEASVEQSITIAKLFAVRLPFSRESANQSIMKTVIEHFPNEVSYMVEDLTACGINPEMRMEDFWNMHAEWTKDILEKEPNGLSGMTKIIAATHHIDRGINPYNLSPENIPQVARAIGVSEEYLETLELALMAVDKYQAPIEREGFSHKDAMLRTRQILDRKYANSHLMQRILEVIDTLGERGEIFSRSPKRER